MYACNGAEQPAGANPPPVRRAAAAHAYAYPAPGVFINPRYVCIYKSARSAASLCLVGHAAAVGCDGGRGLRGSRTRHSGPGAVPPRASQPR